MVNLEKERNKQLELAQKRLQQNIEDIKKLAKKIEKGYDVDLFDNDIITPLAISERKQYIIELSTGGGDEIGADGFIVEVDPETNEIIQVKYYAANWFWYQEITLNDYKLEQVKKWFVELLGL